MKDLLLRTSLVVLIVILGLFLYSRFGPGLPISSVVTTKQNLFMVSGEGKVTVVPDQARIDMGVTANRPTVAQAQTQANTAISNIAASLRDLGIEEKDIQTSNYSVYPQYDFQGRGTITGYIVNVNLAVTVRDLEKINQAIDRSTAQGANVVSGIQLTVDDSRRKELLQEAREKAVAEAREKAQSLSRAAGITLGKIVDIQEGGVTPPGPVLDRVALAAEGRGGGGGTDIQPGSTDIISQITLFYETR